MPGDPANAADEDLVRAVKRDDAAAIEELYRRHAPGAKNYAKGLMRNSFDADDVFSEAFYKVVRAIQRGKGPTGPFRPYLLRAVRTCAADHWDAQSRQDLVREPVELPAEDGGYDRVLNENDRNLAGAAFASLPVRWQTVLWHLDVEGDSPRRVAPLLGIEPNAVSAVAVRARRGLRKAYLEAYTRSALGEDCKPVLDLLVKSVLQDLTSAESTRLRKHLDDCPGCAMVAGELKDTRSTMRRAVGPWFLAIPAGAPLAGSTAVAPLDSASQPGLPTGGMNMGVWTGGLAAAAVAAVIAVAAATGISALQPAAQETPAASSQPIPVAAAALDADPAQVPDPAAEPGAEQSPTAKEPPPVPVQDPALAAPFAAGPGFGAIPEAHNTARTAPVGQDVSPLVPSLVPSVVPSVPLPTLEPVLPPVPGPTGSPIPVPTAPTSPPVTTAPTIPPVTPPVTTPAPTPPTNPGAGCVIWIQWWLCL
ncbi:sigma-70 family RNA polymerase sigma factor [Pseudarthrobacter sp. NamB4]|uniref:sigma-70 family RNA polymerase sigma factor n=1 Tax=Pseudarthrobacter sp. NamB4 TaxID=2576837 RepID=UPI0010FF0C09|nr:sigma-70 family RNA polymerase sigma factor [Pseudarthrobacter sp. NamB4]TLM70893.1 sigma-70 family RNA polymerase sigma factor [Pseudarthrobacter sp. NamB4]